VSTLFRAKESQCKHVVVFMHIPPFTKNVDEDDCIFNIPRSRRVNLLKQFAEANVSTVFSGHFHRNGGGFWGTTNPDGSTSKVRVGFCHLFSFHQVSVTAN